MHLANYGEILKVISENFSKVVEELWKILKNFEKKRKQIVQNLEYFGVIFLK